MELEKKQKVVFVIGSTGTGKSKLAIEIAARFDGEIINSDKIQVYKGLPIVTNKVTDEETLGISHHLIDVIDPDVDFTAADFRRAATDHVDSILARGHLPIIAGGSNSFVEELVEGNGGEFKAKYSCCFLWIDVSFPVLFPKLGARIDRMIEVGLLDEVIAAFDPDQCEEDDYYTGGIRRAIGVPELHRYWMEVLSAADRQEKEENKTTFLEKAIEEMKQNTCKLAESQVGKIHRLCTLPGWNIHRLEADKVFADESIYKNDDLEEEMVGEKAYQELLLRRGLEIVREFLKEDEVLLPTSDSDHPTSTTTTDSTTSDERSGSDDGQDGVVDGGGVNGDAIITDRVIYI